MRISQNFCIACVRLYRLTLAPLFISLGVQCRFSPTCSEYALGALKNHGAAKGSLLALGRLMRCHPFCQGGHDPVPEVRKIKELHLRCDLGEMRNG